jgi:hypothetical protein
VDWMLRVKEPRGLISDGRPGTGDDTSICDLPLVRDHFISCETNTRRS